MKKDIISLIFSISQKPNAFDILESKFKNIKQKELSEVIVDCGVIPEVFDHDSSEEKLWAKYSDILLSKSFDYLGLDSEVIGARGGSADVLAKDKSYTVIGDAKTFRLSRTAKNQKDFKIEALDSWRSSNDYSVLVSPLFQYPSVRSQIYSQAIQKNVVLISYVHLKFLLDSEKITDLEKLWNVGNTLQKKLKKKNYKKARLYWEEVDKTVCSITNKSEDELIECKKFAIERIKNLGKAGINYWKDIIKKYKKLPKEKAIKLLIKAHKIEQKIEQIKKSIEINLE